VVVHVTAGYIYWTDMGDPKANDGSIERSDLEGRNRTTIVPQGGTFTPKQLQLDKKNTSSTGQIVKACESCDRIWTVRISRHL